MSIKIQSQENRSVPKLLGSQITAPSMDVRPRIRRRMPNIQKPPSGSSGQNTQPAKPVSRPSSSKEPLKSTSQQPQRRNSATRVRRPSSGSKSAQPEQTEPAQPEPTETEEQDVKFIDVPSVHSSTKFSRLQEKDIQRISQKEILEKSQETKYEHVYEADLHAAQIVDIDNLERFTKLRVLDLSCNFIQRIDNLEHNTDLRELKLYDNDLERIENLEKLKELHHLQLQHNRIKSIGKGLQSQRKLRILRLDSNCLCRLEVREIASCGFLTSLDLSNNKLDNIAAASCLTNLEELFLVNNRLRMISDLSRCKKLQEVDVSYNRLADVAGLKGLSRLTCLHASNNQLTSLKSLGKLKGLQEMNIKCNRLADMKHVVDFYPGLQVLDVSDNYVETWQQVERLAGLSELVEVYISGNPFASENGPKPMYHNDLRVLLPGLDILDGAHMKKASSRAGTPLMRPMSASSVVTSRHVESQMKSIEDEMSVFEENLASRFESLRAVMQQLPPECPSRPATGASTQSVSSARPVSRSGKRSMIKLAQDFAAHQYTPEGDS